MFNHIHITETDQDILRSLLDEFVENFDEFESEVYGGAEKGYCVKALEEFDIIFVEEGTPYPRLDDDYLFALECFVVGVKISYRFPETNKTYRYEDARETLDRLGEYFKLLREYEIPWVATGWDNYPTTGVKH